MKAAVVSKAGGPAAIEVKDVDRPTVEPGDVLVRVAYAGVNFIDTYQRSGVYPHPMPHIPGAEGSGVIESVGDAVTGCSVGQRVAWTAAPGSYAEFVRVPATALLDVPDTLPLSIAAALPLQGMTAHYLIRSVFPVTSGTRILLTGAAGGVGRLASQIALAQGATVIGTVSTEDKIPHTLTPHSVVVDDWADVPQRIDELGSKMDVVYDGIGRASFKYTLTCLRRAASCASLAAPPAKWNHSIRNSSTPWVHSFLRARRSRTTPRHPRSGPGAGRN